MNETQQELRNILNASDQVLRAFIAELEVVVSTPTEKWEFETRRNAMLRLHRSAEIGAERFGSWMEQGVWIKHIVQIHGLLESIKTTAKYASFSQMRSRIWGRSSLKKDLEKLVQLFGQGCECEMEIRGSQSDSPSPVLKYKLASSDTKPSEYMSVEEVAQFLNVSRCTITKLFAHYHGVLDLSTGNARKRGRRYRVLRIPRSALNRFIQSRRVG